MSLISSIATKLFSNVTVQRIVDSFLREFMPVVVFHDTVFVTRYHDVVEILNRDGDFTISQINAARMAGTDVPFFLGMDRSPQHDREKALMEKVIKREDLDRIQHFVHTRAKQVLADAETAGTIDAVNGYARLISLHLLDSYFGVPVNDETTMKYWMRIIFNEIFLNITNDLTIRNAATSAAEDLKKYMFDVIAERKAELANHNVPEDNVLNRLILMQKEHTWITDDVIRRNICGMILGAVDTTSKSTMFVIDYLLQNPDQLNEARNAAKDGNIKIVGKYVLEALRFNPHNPILVRFCANDTSIGKETGSIHKIPGGSTVYVGILSAMFDPRAFSEPMEFKIHRDTAYLHFSHGLHACFGRYINMVTIPELVGGLLNQKNLRRASGSNGHIKYDGPFPDRLMLEFDKS